MSSRRPAEQKPPPPPPKAPPKAGKASSAVPPLLRVMDGDDSMFPPPGAARKTGPPPSKSAPNGGAPGPPPSVPPPAPPGPVPPGSVWGSPKRPAAKPPEPPKETPHGTSPQLTGIEEGWHLGTDLFCEWDDEKGDEAEAHAEPEPGDAFTAAQKAAEFVMDDEVTAPVTPSQQAPPSPAPRWGWGSLAEDANDDEKHPEEEEPPADEGRDTKVAAQLKAEAKLSESLAIEKEVADTPLDIKHFPHLNGLLEPAEEQAGEMREVSILEELLGIKPVAAGEKREDEPEPEEAPAVPLPPGAVIRGPKGQPQPANPPPPGPREPGGGAGPLAGHHGVEGEGAYSSGGSMMQPGQQQQQVQQQQQGQWQQQPQQQQQQPGMAMSYPVANGNNGNWAGMQPAQRGQQVQQWNQQDAYVAQCGGATMQIQGGDPNLMSGAVTGAMPWLTAQQALPIASAAAAASGQQVAVVAVPMTMVPVSSGQQIQAGDQWNTQGLQVGQWHSSNGMDPSGNYPQDPQQAQQWNQGNQGTVRNQQQGLAPQPMVPGPQPGPAMQQAQRQAAAQGHPQRYGSMGELQPGPVVSTNPRGQPQPQQQPQQQSQPQPQQQQIGLYTGPQSRTMGGAGTRQPSRGGGAQLLRSSEGACDNETGEQQMVEDMSWAGAEGQRPWPPTELCAALFPRAGPYCVQQVLHVLPARFGQIELCTQGVGGNMTSMCLRRFAEEDLGEATHQEAQRLSDVITALRYTAPNTAEAEAVYNMLHRIAELVHSLANTSRVSRRGGGDKAVLSDSSPWVEIVATMALSVGEPEQLVGIARPHGVFREERDPRDAAAMVTRPGNVLAVSEFIGGGTLLRLVGELPCPGPLREQQAWPFVNSLLGAIASLRRLGIAHGGLGLQSILRRDASSAEVALVGLGRVVAAGSSAVGGHEEGRPSPYRAPETHRPAIYDTCAADLFACGVVAYALATGEYPWASTKQGQGECVAFQYAWKHGLEAYFDTRRVQGVGGEPRQRLASCMSPRYRQLLVTLLDFKPSNRVAALQGFC